MKYETSIARAGLGLSAGALVGTLLVAAIFVLTDLDYFREWGLKTGTIMIILIYAGFFWVLGLLVAAPVPWLILHRLGYRGPFAAVVMGLGLTFLVTLGLLTSGFGLLGDSGHSASDSGGATWVNGVLTAHGWFEAARMSGWVALFGLPVALVVWRVAYRRTA